jgi:predicted DNA-binding ribbon-helix-helix protein
MLPSPIIKRSVVCRGHKTSVSLENEFWEIFHMIARDRGITKSKLFEEFWHTCPEGTSLSSHIRTSILHLVIERSQAS